MNVAEGDAHTKQIGSVAILPVNATDKKVTYSVDDDTIATVSATGLITAVKVGSATITVASKSQPAVKDTIAVTVEA